MLKEVRSSFIRLSGWRGAEQVPKTRREKKAAREHHGPAGSALLASSIPHFSLILSSASFTSAPLDTLRC